MIKKLKQLFCKHVFTKSIKIREEVPYTPNWTTSWRFDVFEIKTCKKCGKIIKEHIGTE